MKKGRSNGPLYILVGMCALLAFITKPSMGLSSKAMQQHTFWHIQSIDTMKFSRDVAREKLDDPSYDTFIHDNIAKIASTGATHVAIGTPYDPEFVPFLRRWVAAARKEKLKVWFRGNMAGWEGWFGYQKIDRNQHTKGILSFISTNKDLFQDGDLFTSCPECENGGPGDPRFNGDAKGHAAFLTNEYREVKKAFRAIDKKVEANTYSMNGDVASLIMDSETTKKLDGRIVVDHYVRTPEDTVADLVRFSQESKGKVILGEFGVPIPDLQGRMTEKEQADWLDSFLKIAVDRDEIEGLNYWTSFGGSTELWNPDGTPREAVAVITSYFKPEKRKLYIDSMFSRHMRNYSLSYDTHIKTFKEKDGATVFIYRSPYDEVTITASGYLPIKIKLSSLTEETSRVKLELEKKNFFTIVRSFFSL